MKTATLAILVIVLSAAVGYAGYRYFSVAPTGVKDEHGAWQLYEDRKLGFSIEYPTDWNLMPCAEDFCLIRGREEKVMLTKGANKILIDPLGRISGNTVPGTAEELVINGRRWRRISADNFAPTATTSIRARRYYRYEAKEDLGLLRDTTTDLSMDPGAFRAHLFLGGESSRATDEAAVGILEGVVSSLTIFYPPPAAPSPTGVWAHYTNEGFYSVYYPKGWCLDGGSFATLTSYCDRIPGRGGSPPKNELQVRIILLDLAELKLVTLDDWLDRLEAFDRQEILLDDERAVWAKGRDKTFGDIHIDLRAVRNGTGYQIHYSPSDSELKGVVDTMVSSFRFIR